MSGFSAAWLSLREPLDHCARAPALARLLRRRLGSHAPIRIVDLATGTGANLRWLAPRLGGSQEWLLVDHDPALLAALPAAVTSWARRSGYVVDLRRDGLLIAGPRFHARARTRPLDLAGDLGALPLADTQLITASALLDLVSASWLESLARRARTAGCDLLFALSYDGRMACDPLDPWDAAIRALVNRHQRGEKGFGPALGPSATAAAADLLEPLGYRLWTRTSDWDMASRHPGAQAELLAGWAAASRELDPIDAAQIGDWLDRRRAHLAAGSSRIRVGHQDLLALLPH